MRNYMKGSLVAWSPTFADSLMAIHDGMTNCGSVFPAYPSFVYPVPQSTTQAGSRPAIFHVTPPLMKNKKGGRLRFTGNTHRFNHSEYHPPSIPSNITPRGDIFLIQSTFSIKNKTETSRSLKTAYLKLPFSTCSLWVARAPFLSIIALSNLLTQYVEPDE